MQPVWRPKILTNLTGALHFSASNGVRNLQASFYATCISRVVVGSPLFVFCKRQDLIGLDVAPPLPTPERRSWLLPGQSNKSARVASLEAKAVTRGVTSHVFFDHAESQMECEIPMLPSTQLAFPWLWLNALFRLLGGDARDLVGLTSPSA
jgi:hypothetical protein